jgi:transposase
MDDLADYAGLLEYLRSLSLVRDVEVESLDGAVVRLRMVVRGDRELLGRGKTTVVPQKVFRHTGVDSSIEVKLLPAQYVRAYVKRNKTDAADAAALLEAALTRMPGSPVLRVIRAGELEKAAAIIRSLLTPPGPSG